MTPRLVALNLLFKAACVGAAFSHHLVLAVGLFVAPDLLLLYGLFHARAQVVCPVVTRFEPSAPGAREVWLTIDDGPDPVDTPRILDALDRHGAQASFFVIGRQAEQHPGLVREILARGHRVEHHTYSHPVAFFWAASPRTVAYELDRARDVLRGEGAHPVAFRPPVGIKNLFLRQALAARGLTCIGWSIRSRDTKAKTAEDVVAYVAPRLGPGAILLLHEGPALRPEIRGRALDRLLAAIQAAGYRCVIPPADRWRVSRTGRPAPRSP